MVKEIKYNRLVDRFKVFLGGTIIYSYNYGVGCEYNFDTNCPELHAYLYYYDSNHNFLDIYYENLIWKYKHDKYYYEFLCDKETITQLICDDFYGRYYIEDKDIIKIRYYGR